MKRKFLLSQILFLLFLALLILVKTVNVAPIAAGETSIGLSSLNENFHTLFGENILWYTITDWLGLVGIAVAAVFAFVGLCMLIKRKSLLKVDEEILALGILYTITIFIYIFFEIVIVNYRPILMPGVTEPEASFPSSHTMVLCTIMGSAMMLVPRYIKNKGLQIAALTFSGLLIAVTIFGRIVSGVHWATDILGGLLISGSLLFLYSAVLDLIDSKKGCKEVPENE